MSNFPILSPDHLTRLPPGTPLETPAAPLPTSPRFNGRLFLLFGGMTLIASVMIVPYALELQGAAALPQTAELTSGVSPLVMLASVVGLQVIQALVLNLPLIALGLVIAPRLGLGAPLFSAWLARAPVTVSWKRWGLLSLGLGFGTGVLLMGLSAGLAPLMPPELRETEVKLPSALSGLLASISAGINEELLLRLFLLSALAGLFKWLRRAPGQRPSVFILWAANILSTLVFGCLHIPNLALIGVPLTGPILLVILLLNGVAGLVLGWLYWTEGLESAMLAHFAADVVLHVIPPLGLVFFPT